MPHSRLPRAERRLQLIGAAATAFLEGGYDNTSMEDVARRAGVSRLIVYRIFESKAELYSSVLQTVLTDLGRTFEGLSPAEVHERAAVSIILPVARRHPDAFRLLWRHSVGQSDFAEYGETFRRFAVFYAREILAEFIENEMILDWASLSAGSQLIDGICLWLDMGDPDQDPVFEAMITAGLSGQVGAWAKTSNRLLG